MKKVIAILFTAIVLFGTASAEIYPETARVVDLNYADDIVTVENFNGFQYTFEGCEDFCLGDGVSLIMDDNDTPKIYDDIIIVAYYCGWKLVNWQTGE